MPTTTDSNIVVVHYGDLNSEHGVFGGHFKHSPRYTFLIDRGAGVDTNSGAVSGREAHANISIMEDDKLVVHYQRGADNDGLKVSPKSYRHWALLAQLELAIVHEPAKTSDQSQSTLRERFADRAAERNPERER